MNHRPNILFLMSDEHRADMAGFAGDPIVRTPTLDWLANTGVVFRNAYTPSPSCVPARQCMLAGQLPKTCGCEGWKDLRCGHMTFPRRLGQYGYRTVACGHLHLIGPDQMQGFQLRPAGDVACMDVEDQREAPPAFNSDDPLNLPNSQKWTDLKEVLRAGPGVSWPADELAVVAAEHFVEGHFVGAQWDRANPQQPVLLYVGLCDPHYPYRCREDLFRYYLPRVHEFPVQTPFDHPVLGKTSFGTGPLQGGLHVPARAVQRARASYCGQIQTMDERLGRVLEALREAGQDLDDWIIVYCSDHGEMLGEHALWEKQKFFEGSVRVPLIIRYPGAGLSGGLHVDRNVSLCDLFATLCTLAGISVPRGLDSRNLAALVADDRCASVNDADASGAAGMDDEVVSCFSHLGHRNVMIKQGSLKYQYYANAKGVVFPEVLFDLANDPHETVNCANHPTYAKALRRFRQRLAQLGYGPDASAAYHGAGYDPRCQLDPAL